MGGDHAPLSENRDFSGTEHPVELKPVFGFEFVHFGPLEKKTERSTICLGLIMAARRSS